ncbi:ribosome biogenesis GTP-binding protein YihA/YsxC [Blochmannia endosymbiont of Polyrhachis (Hedomyrma) turneri]|uniref:ribosome biogenesis GTP-binding protein YihA/YsxC n=1 Tax=Blochmannia endosymbiont of Polyrhachis (Hedomyrma) turneri TaxID=1505596 RepID=UPI00061A7965|nr:ribosome biogenesis GTP-binding protein YihA/YsxC [Blochmannia endosymbiont of Polyrhachis (Hedomyrma) turneri]AKC60172.1 putative GTP-binding protein EngB [Blochmannia endosymbiont of Polyrhachis (Hedomyrma) turneri]
MKKYTNHIINYLLSAPNINQLPNDHITEIAFMGRSNSGKSSTINILTNQKLTKTSKKPGCTKLINLFEIPTLKIRFIDFPGYGYAKTQKTIKTTWENTINQYLKKRKNLIGVILLIDIRRSINQTDRAIVQQNNQNNTPTLLLLNKSDKITDHSSSIQLQEISKTINSQNTQILIFSSRTAKGINKLRYIIKNWCCNKKNNNYKKNYNNNACL